MAALYYPHLGRRFTALVIDYLILGFVGKLLIPGNGDVFVYLTLALWYGYFVVLNVRWGGSLGKQAMGLRVRTLNDGPVSARQALIRDAYWLVVIVLRTVFASWGAASGDDFLLSVAQYVGFGWMVVEFATAYMSPQKRSVHDLLAGTMVVRA